MTHRKDLVKKGFRHGMYGNTREELLPYAKRWQKYGRIKFFRIVPDEDRFELYIKR